MIENTKSKFDRILGGIERAKEILMASQQATRVHIEIGGGVETIPTISYSIEEYAPKHRVTKITEEL